MIPKVTEIVGTGKKKMPSLTYRLNKTGRAIGKVNGLSAIEQAVFLMLNIERYEWEIFDWSYGSEITKLFGRPASLITGDIERLIKDALLTDNRIKAVVDFEFEVEKSVVSVKFTVKTAEGNFEVEKEVEF